MIEPGPTRDTVLDRIEDLKKDIDSLKSHTQRHARLAKSLLAAAVPDHVVENALESSRGDFDRLERRIRVDLENIKTHNHSLRDQCRVDTQVDHAERSLEGALMEHRLTEAQHRRAQAQDKIRQTNIKEETAVSLGMDRQILFPMQASRSIRSY